MPVPKKIGVLSVDVSADLERRLQFQQNRLLQEQLSAKKEHEMFYVLKEHKLFSRNTESSRIRKSKLKVYKVF